jgi:hypothetical protein
MRHSGRYVSIPKFCVDVMVTVCRARQLPWWRGAAESSNSPVRVQPGFRKQLYWWCSRAALRKMREPMQAFSEYVIFALTGAARGLLHS